jgi:hypothetical protein
MIREFIVHKDRYFQDIKGKMHAPGERVMVDDENAHIKCQLWKLVPVETNYDYTIGLPVVEDVMAQADKVIAKHKEETGGYDYEEPAKAVKPEKKPAEDIPKSTAKNMMERVQEFVEQQEKDKK